MASSASDSAIFRDFFGTPQMRSVFSDERLAERYVEVEVALAKAEAKVGVIPAAAAEEIVRRGAGVKLDLSVAPGDDFDAGKLSKMVD